MTIRQMARQVIVRCIHLAVASVVVLLVTDSLWSIQVTHTLPAPTTTIAARNPWDELLPLETLPTTSGTPGIQPSVYPPFADPSFEPSRKAIDRSLSGRFDGRPLGAEAAPIEMLSGYPLPTDLEVRDRLDALQSEATTPQVTDEFPTLKMSGFFQGDAVLIHQDSTNIATVGDAQNGIDFRRARLKAKGKVWENVQYSIEMDFAFAGRPSFMDVWMKLIELPVGDLIIGHWIQPFGMDANTSATEMTFLERGLPVAFVPFRKTGVGLYRNRDDEMGTYQVSLFRFPTDPYGGNVGDNGGFSLGNRWTRLLAYAPERESYVHLGFGYCYIDPSNDIVRYQVTPELFVGESGGADVTPANVPSNLPAFVDTGQIPTTNSNLLNVELAGAFGPLTLQSEAYFVIVNQLGLPTESFSGAYAQVSYVLTGEHRAYRADRGIIGRVRPYCPFGSEGFGAWEIATRWSYIDLDSGAIAGGQLNDLSAGLNWYLNPHAKFQFNYIHARLNDRQLGASNANFFALRAQVDY